MTLSEPGVVLLFSEVMILCCARSSVLGLPRVHDLRSAAQTVGRSHPGTGREPFLA